MTDDLVRRFKTKALAWLKLWSILWSVLQLEKSHIKGTDPLLGKRYFPAVPTDSCCHSLALSATTPVIGPDRDGPIARGGDRLL